MITGVNHLTFSVSDLEESAGFYTGVLGFEVASRGDREAHLLAGDAWIVLIQDPYVKDGAPPEYTHAAFSVSVKSFNALERRIRRSGAGIWQENCTPGRLLYFLDPDGHKLEIRASNLQARIEFNEQDL